MGGEISLVPRWPNKPVDDSRIFALIRGLPKIAQIGVLALDGRIVWRFGRCMFRIAARDRRREILTAMINGRSYYNLSTSFPSFVKTRDVDEVLNKRFIKSGYYNLESRGIKKLDTIITFKTPSKLKICITIHYIYDPYGVELDVTGPELKSITVNYYPRSDKYNYVVSEFDCDRYIEYYNIFEIMAGMAG